MATKTGKYSATHTDFVLTDDDVDETAVDNVFGGTATVHSLYLDAPSGESAVKLYDNADPTVGTGSATPPDFIFKVTEPVAWTIVDGITFTNLSYAAVRGDGGDPGYGDGGTTAPAVTVKLHATVR
mgnify:FL=1